MQSFLSSNPEWAWVAGHLMFGIVLGGLLAYWPGRVTAGEQVRQLA